MGRVRYRLVDVFTETAFAGNPLCVVLDPCPTPLMRRIARESNLSETTFPIRTGQSSYEMRIFTPTIELPFAGHPSVGTAWCLGPGRWTQTTTGGTVIVEATERGARMTQPLPEFTGVAVPETEITAALGLSTADRIVRSTAGGVTHILVATSCSLDKLEPDLAVVAAVSRHCNAHTIVPMRRLDEATIQARVFAPAAGVPEDPGSGSAAGPIGIVASEIWGTHDDVTVLMGSEIGRPSRIEVQTGIELWVGGPIVMSAEGHFHV